MSTFDLILFSTDPALIRPAVEAGVEAVVVDWERIGKERRQAGADTQIGADTLDDLRVVRASTDATVICRVNGPGAWTAREIDDAVGAGADEVLVPMVRAVVEVEQVVALAAGRCAVSILLETAPAVASAADFGRLPLRRVYVGLNDLAIERRSASIFSALSDGTLDHVRRGVRAPFGFGGLTAPDRGAPVPTRLLMGEMARLGCQFTFLRRSFHADARNRNAGRLVREIAEAMERVRSRRPAEVEDDHAELLRVVAQLEAERSRVAT